MYDNLYEFKRLRPGHFIDERCKSNIKIRPYWENSQWKSLDDIEDPFANKFRTNKIFDKKSEITLEALSTIQTPYNGDSFTMDTNTLSVMNPVRERSVSNDKRSGINLAMRTSEYVQNNLESIISIKMRPFYKQNETRSKSVQKKHPHIDINSSYISYTHFPCSQMARNSRNINVGKLPKIKTAEKRPKIIACETEQTLVLSTLNDDNSLVHLDLTKPVVLASDFPTKEELEDKWKQKIISNQKIKRVKPFKYNTASKSENERLADERLKITPNVYGQTDGDEEVDEITEKFKRKLNNIIQSLHPGILNIDIPLSRKIELIKYRAHVKANECTKLLDIEIDDLLQWLDKIEKQEEKRIAQSNRRKANLMNLSRNYSTGKQREMPLINLEE